MDLYRTENMNRLASYLLKTRGSEALDLAREVFGGCKHGHCFVLVMDKQNENR